MFFPTDVLSIDKKFINNKSLTTVFILRGIPFMSKRTEILKASVSFGGGRRVACLGEVVGVTPTLTHGALSNAKDIHSDFG